MNRGNLSDNPVRIGNATLYLGDCRDILPTLGKVDALVTDPPYGIGEHGGRFRARKGQRVRVLKNLGWDKARPPAEVFDLMLSAANDHVIWGGNYFADLLPPSKGWLYWQKLMGGDFADGELAWTSRDKALREFTCCPKGRETEHPTQKPLPVMKWCLGFYPDAETILDPFMGSGTTGIAALQMGKAFIGIEREPEYFEIACRRIREVCGDAGPLFGEAA
jgi:site-specific DNA-methyltransferase (adenine-specific)